MDAAYRSFVIVNRPKLKTKLADQIPNEASLTIKWSPLDLKSSRDVRKSLENRRDAVIYLAPESWKNDLPLLCSSLGLKYRASAKDVSLILKSKSSSVFSVKAIEAPGFIPSDPKGSTEVISCAEEEKETENVRVKIRIPIKYEQELESGNPASQSKKRREFEHFVKSELSDAFGVPKSFLEPEVQIAEIQDGSVSVTVILSAAALTLIYVGKALPQEPTWQDRRFEILMGMGGAAAGSIVGVMVGGPKEEAIGSLIGSLIGLGAGLTTAWYVNRDVQDAAARAGAYLTFIRSAIAIIIHHHHRDEGGEQ